jgi:predicted AlkP superfamily pyrophosphatase or phosphodiesterase
MLPAARGDSPSLADVLTGALAAILGTPHRLELPRVSRAAVVLVDGLGVSALRPRAGHARRLMAAAPGRRDVLDAGFPSTTAAALATLTTGRAAGEHGLVSYSALDRVNDRVLNLLRGWDAQADPRAWQPHPTVFESAAAAGVEPVVIGAERYRDTGFTDAVLRGARFEAHRSIADRLAAAAELLRAPGERLLYVYVPELDQAGHAEGAGSAAWTRRLEELDAALAPLAGLGADAGVLLTADHGMVDIPEHRRLVIDGDDPLWSGVRHVAGEPRCLHLAVDEPGRIDEVLARWRAAEEARSWVVSRDEAIAAGWYGPVGEGVAARLGDVIVAARSEVAYYDARTATAASRAMVGQHGSFSDEERRVPLARWGAFV